MHHGVRSSCVGCTLEATLIKAYPNPTRWGVEGLGWGVQGFKTIDGALFRRVVCPGTSTLTLGTFVFGIKRDRRYIWRLRLRVAANHSHKGIFDKGMGRHSVQLGR